MRTDFSVPRRLAVLCASLVLAAGCSSDAPTAQSTMASHMHQDPLLAADASPAERQKLAELKAWSAPFHDLDKAAAANYTTLFACIDETTVGVDPAVARGMGYHIMRGDVDLIHDGKVDIDQPEFLVYAPSVRDAELAPADRLKAARLVGFEYYLPGSPDDPAPEFFGDPFDYSPQFGGWVRHIYLWGNNPEGLTENFNAKVPLCADPLVL